MHHFCDKCDAEATRSCTDDELKRFIRGAAFLDKDIWKNEEFRGGAEKLMDVALEEMVQLNWVDGVQADFFK